MEIAVVVNMRARHGSEAIARFVRSSLPRARVAVTRSLDEVRAWVQGVLVHDPPALLLSGGGDGTAVGLVNELRDSGVGVGALGLLRLGTGNGWANVTGSPRPREAIERIAALAGRRPGTRRFSLVEVDGRVAPFLGTGWDAEILSDFKAQSSAGLYGYLKGMFIRTIPRQLFGDGLANVVVTNLGDDALTVDERGQVVPLPGGERGRVLYRGPASVAAVGTTEEWGFGFRAFPFAHAAPGRASLRVYAAPVLQATRNMFRLWRGEHPLADMHNFLLTRARLEFDREVPFQIGGDLAQPRRQFEFSLAEQGVDVVDWSRVRG